MDRVYLYLNKNKWAEWLLFAAVFWLFIVHMHLNRGLSDMIPGYHYWRKSDTLAQIMNYYYNGLNFFDHSMYFNQMESGAKAVGEFPLFYYLIAVQKKIFGNHDIIIKYNWMVVMFFGLMALFKIALHYTKNHLWALAVPFTLFLSPVYVVYSLEYIPDPISLSFCFIGMYFLLQYHLNNKFKYIILTLLFISLTGLMKPFFMIPYIAFLIVFIGTKILKREKVLKYWFYIIPFLVVWLWFYYVKWYSAQVNCNCFLTSINPIWAGNEEIIARINGKIMRKWFASYFNPVYLYVLGAMFLFNCFFKIKENKQRIIYLIMSVLGSITFVLLFYMMFMNHDYYIYPVLFLAPLILLMFLNNISNLIVKPTVKYGVGILLLVAVYAGCFYSWEVRKTRLETRSINAYHQFKDYRNLEPFLQKHNVGQDDFIVAFSDESPNYALILLNRKGWSGFQTLYRKRNVKELVDQGAKFLVINKNIRPKVDSIALKGVSMTYLGDTNQIFLYKLNK